MSKSFTDLEKEGMLRVSCVYDELPSSSSNAPLVKLLLSVLPDCCPKSIAVEPWELVEFEGLCRPPLPQGSTLDFIHMRFVKSLQSKDLDTGLDFLNPQ